RHWKVGKMKHFGHVFTFVAMLAVCGTLALSQGFQGGVRGVVMDPGSAIIPGVEVQLINQGTNAARSTITNEAGQYVFSAVSPGTYKLRATLPGFKSFETSGVVISTQSFPVIDIK